MRSITEKRTARLETEGKRLGRNSTIALPSTPGRHPKSKPQKAITSRKPRKPMPKVNAARQAKRTKAYAKKLAAYKRSETYRIVEQRAGGVCEFAGNVRSLPMEVVARYACFDGYGRCISSYELEHHHKTYARFGGNELPEDVDVLCKSHHEYVESLKTGGNRRSRQSRTT